MYLLEEPSIQLEPEGVTAQKIFLALDTKKPRSYQIQSGYFETHLGIGVHSKNTMNCATNLAFMLKKNNRKNSIRHDLLVNDLGGACSATSCSLKEPQVTSVESIKTLIGVSENPIPSITLESTMRNRGLRFLHSYQKYDRQLENPRLYFEEKDGSRIWKLESSKFSDLVLCVEKEGRLAARCPLIMGAYYAKKILDLQKAEGITKRLVTFVDICGYEDKLKLMKGAEVASLMLSIQIPEPFSYSLMLALTDAAANHPIIYHYSEKSFI